ncbi:MAG: NAD(P)/FAD-dependent oxidoreductase [Syntrophomonadaceae bacterium]|nr:NAD(P)/FAD-dependent oxidoreductase [Syntrophomonadaceae bacterium]
MNSSFPALFKPGYIGSTWVRNRIVMAPMASNFAYTNGEVSEPQIAYYAARARGGVGLIIVEAACVTEDSGREGFGQLQISHPRYVIGLNRLNEAIKAYGSRTMIQLFHAGRQTSSEINGGQPVAPSPISCNITREEPHELTNLEVKQIINQFIAAARYADLAGFDGIELHAAHGYLINQFLSPHTNHRQDEYGGSLANRQRFLLEIITEIKEALPAMTISVRLNIDDFIPGGLQLDESLKVCKSLELAGVDIINCSSGTYESGLNSIEPASYEEGWRVYLAAAVKKVVNIPVITGGMIRHPEFANQVLQDKKADFIFFGRSLLADPQWPHKARHNQVKEIRPCISCNNCISNNFRGLGIRCTVNPFTGRESILDKDHKVRQPAHAIIVGGGPAGIQAALSLRRHGLEVTLYEKENRLGGFMNLAGIPPHKEQINAWRDYLLNELDKSGTEVIYPQEFTAATLEALRPEILIIATGSAAVHPDIEGCAVNTGVEAIEVLGGELDLTGQEVVIIGGGSTGCETADYLIGKAKGITIVEKEASLATDAERKNRRALLNRLSGAGVKTKTEVHVTEVMPNRVRIHHNETEEILATDQVIWATGFKPLSELHKLAQETTPYVFLIGDALQVRGFKEAVLEGEMLGNIITGLLN